MARLLYLFSFLLTSFAYGQSTTEAPPTAYTEPAGITSVIVFLVLFFGSIILFSFWVWYKNKKSKQQGDAGH